MRMGEGISHRISNWFCSLTFGSYHGLEEGKLGGKRYKVSSLSWISD